MFNAMVSDFKLASADVVGLGVDNVGELYVTHNGARCHMTYLPRLTLKREPIAVAVVASLMFIHQ